ncbi:hypothetical protein IU46_011800 [Pantoea agglomerans]|nr:hypothetical protein T296_17505 [Pantoea agglomerans Eh318]KYN65799.1 hypothetical protein IU46_011800 [Pantoea agglomerans]
MFILLAFINSNNLAAGYLYISCIIHYSCFHWIYRDDFYRAIAMFTLQLLIITSKRIILNNNFIQCGVSQPTAFFLLHSANYN